MSSDSYKDHIWEKGVGQKSYNWFIGITVVITIFCIVIIFLIIKKRNM